MASSRVDTAMIVADMLQSISAKWVLDCTYGVGRFYKFYRPKILVGIDPHIYPDDQYIVKPDILIPRPVWSAKKILEALNMKFDVAVVDPPFRERPRGYDKRLYYYNLFGSPELIIEKSFELAKNLGIPHLLLHFHTTKNHEEWTPIKTVEYEYKQGYLQTHSYFILYEFRKEFGGP